MYCGIPPLSDNIQVTDLGCLNLVPYIPWGSPRYYLLFLFLCFSSCIASFFPSFVFLCAFHWWQRWIAHWSKWDLSPRVSMWGHKLLPAWCSVSSLKQPVPEVAFLRPEGRHWKLTSGTGIWCNILQESRVCSTALRGWTHYHWGC